MTLQYGKEAGNLATDSMTAAGNAAMTYMNIQSLGAKGLAKRTARNTGKTLAKNVINAHVGEGDKDKAYTDSSNKAVKEDKN